MADNLTDTAESLVLNWLNPALGAPTRPTAPLKLRLMTTNGSDASAGTEVTGGSYAAQSVTIGSSSSGSTVTNSADVTYTAMPACTVVGVEIWDSAGTPVRLWYGPLTANKTVASGDTFTITAGSLSLAMG